MKQTAKPDISSFLEQHPMSNITDDEDDKDSDMLDNGAVKLEVGWSGEEGTDIGTGASNGEADHFGTWKGLDYDGDEESGAVLEMGVGSLGYGMTDLGDELEASEPAEGLAASNMGMCYALAYIRVILIVSSSSSYSNRPAADGRERSQ